MIFTLLKIYKIKRDVDKGLRDPAALGKDMAEGAVLDMIIWPAIFSLLGLALLFFLGFSTLFGGPFLFFKILFFVALVVGIILGSIIFLLLSAIKRIVKRSIAKRV